MSCVALSKLGNATGSVTRTVASSICLFLLVVGVGLQFSALGRLNKSLRIVEVVVASVFATMGVSGVPAMRAALVTVVCGSRVSTSSTPVPARCKFIVRSTARCRWSDMSMRASVLVPIVTLNCVMKSCTMER